MGSLGITLVPLVNFNNEGGDRSGRWTIADWIMFSLGISGAGYELFFDNTQNYLRYVLILALLRLWQTVADILRSR